MKILVVGDGHSAIHEVAVVNAFKQLGHEVEPFFWHPYFQARNPLVRFWLQVQNKFLIGSKLNELNRNLIRKALMFAPKLIFIYRGTHVTSRTLTKIKQNLPNCKIFGHNNDDPFAPCHPPWLWRHFMKCVPIYDLVFAYRKHNITEYLNSNAKRAELLMPWYIPGQDFPLKHGENIPSKYDVIFVGHYERDNRIEYIERAANSRFSFGLFGPDWDRAPNYDWLKKYQPILPLRGHKYRESLISAKIALCFLSSLNRDTYTRRCFEIPAMGVLLLSQYTDELAQIFEDGVDVVFFRNPDEMIQKINYLLQHEELRRKIAASGRERVIGDQHDIVSRMNNVLNFMGTN
jgi:glycosyltransferase involved in cell wall biosynthesis